MSALLGLLALHAAGSVLMALLTRARVVDTLRSPTSTWAAIAGLFAVALGPAGGVLGAALLVTLWRTRTTPATPSTPWVPLAVLSALVLARPSVPTGWDEFVWLAKARIEALGFSEGVRAALDPALRVGPAGYPPLWPLAVSWVGLGVDALDAHVLAGSLLMLLSVASAAEAWWPTLITSRRGRLLGLAVALSAPLVWVHVRSTYLDLPLGLLAAATVGFLCTGRFGLASVVAVVMAGFKDEGL
ncbi:MAG: hypothetical protein JNG84_02475, partial [Archangium sp.]|nr:hypothetical protein [Archangium sp.]